MEGVVFGESPRWHDGRLWFSDWGANQVLALGTDGSPRGGGDRHIVPDVHRLPPGRATAGPGLRAAAVAALWAGGSPVTHADLSAVSAKPWNDTVVDDQGNAHVNTIGFEFSAASSRQASSCSPRRTAISARSPATSRGERRVRRDRPDRRPELAGGTHGLGARGAQLPGDGLVWKVRRLLGAARQR